MARSERTRYQTLMRQRYPVQPWLYDVRDLAPQGAPETTVFLPKGDRIEGLYIRGLIEGDMMLGVRTSEHGEPISCAIATDVPAEGDGA
jgi:hypothetical protein